MSKMILNGKEYICANSDFELERIDKYTVNPSLTSNTLNLIKTIPANTLIEGYYNIGIVEAYQRDHNRSYFQISGVSGKVLFPATDGNSITDVQYDNSGYSYFTRNIIVKILDRTTDLKFYLWGNGYSPSYVTISIYKICSTAYGTNGPSDHHYSTSEKVIGTWIDGKPIYEITKTVDTGNSNNASIQLSTTIADVINITGRNLQPSGNIVSVNYYSADTDKAICYFRKSDYTIQIRAGSNYGKGQYAITVQYTKTTD